MKYPKRPLSEGEVRRMFAKSRGRDRVLLTLLWRGGLRNFEACAVRGADVELRPDGTGRIHVVRGKGDIERYVGLDRRAAEIVCGWLGAQQSGSWGGHILQTASGQPLQTTQVRRTVRLLAGKAGIRDRVHPHALRHRYAREMYDEGIGIRAIQLNLGHQSLKTTQIYLSSLGCDEAVELAAGRTW